MLRALDTLQGAEVPVHFGLGRGIDNGIEIVCPCLVLVLVHSVRLHDFVNHGAASQDFVLDIQILVHLPVVVFLGLCEIRLRRRPNIILPRLLNGLKALGRRNLVHYYFLGEIYFLK